MSGILFLPLTQLTLYGAKAVNFHKLIVKTEGERGMPFLFLFLFTVVQTSELTVTQSVKPVCSKLTCFYSLQKR